jgi:FkbM family methyltransferase
MSHVALGCPSSHNGCDQSASINVTAFDGNKKFTDTVQALVREQWPRTAGKFYYNHVALLDKPGYVSFSQGETENGFIDPSGKDKSDLSVRGTTVDLYMEENGLATLDVLKVDAEGFDDSVLRGAHDALATSVRFLQFEANPLKIETIHMLDRLGFTCFLAGSLGLRSFAKLTGCVEFEFFRDIFGRDTSVFVNSANLETPIVIGGNAYCAHRTRASRLVKLFEDHAVMSDESKPLDMSNLNRCTNPPHPKCPALGREQCRDSTVDFVCRLRTEKSYHDDGCADSPGWEDKCHTRFMTGYCVNGDVPKYLDWIGADNDLVKQHCCVCGKGKPASVGGPASAHSPPLGSDPSYPLCKGDTPNWDNGHGVSCEGYVSSSFCRGGVFLPHANWTSGFAFNFPEQNCCVCGKGRLNH